MTMTMTQTRPSTGKLVAGASLLLLLAACGGGAALGLDSLGDVFARAFAADANGVALANPASAGLTVNPNIDPFNP